MKRAKEKLSAEGLKARVEVKDGGEIEPDTFKNVTVGSLNCEKGIINHFWFEQDFGYFLKKCGFKNIVMNRMSRIDGKFFIERLNAICEK